MSEQQLRDMIDFASRFAERYFAKNGIIRPLYYMVTANGEQFITEALSDDKDESVVLMRALMEIRNVVRYVFIDEAWTARVQSRKDLDRIKLEGLSTHPGRVEVVLFVGEDAESGRLLVCHRRIVRPRHGKARLDQIKDQPGAHSEGRMIGLLPTRGMTRQ